VESNQILLSDEDPMVLIVGCALEAFALLTMPLVVDDMIYWQCVSSRAACCTDWQRVKSQRKNRIHLVFKLETHAVISTCIPGTPAAHFMVV